MGDLDLRHPLSEVCRKGRDEGGMFVTGNHPLHNRPAIGSEHASPIGHLDTGNLSCDPVHDAGGKNPEQRILPALADGPDHVKPPLFHFFDQTGNLFRRILKIGIERHNDLTPDD